MHHIPFWLSVFFFSYFCGKNFWVGRCVFIFPQHCKGRQNVFSFIFQKWSQTVKKRNGLDQRNYLTQLIDSKGDKEEGLRVRGEWWGREADILMAMSCRRAQVSQWTAHHYKRHEDNSWIILYNSIDSLRNTETEEGKVWGEIMCMVWEILNLRWLKKSN